MSHPLDEQTWHRMSEEITDGWREWRLQHPKATLRQADPCFCYTFHTSYALPVSCAYSLRTPMRLPTLTHDFWTLRSGAAMHREHRDSFWIPPYEARVNLQIGQAAQLIFDIEGEDQHGQVSVQGERMWVIVAAKIGDYYLGILDSQPAALAPSDTVYLCFGAEIPFLAEHVIDIANPPQDYVRWQLSQAPERIWPRD